MKHLRNFLLPESVNLSLRATEEQTSFTEVIKLLQDDPRVTDWEKFYQSILARPLFPLLLNHKAMVICHGRTNTVRDLVMSVGRSNDGIIFDNIDHPVALLFVVGIPHELNNEYLRIMGSIARACGDLPTLEKLLSTENPHEFIEALSTECDAN